MQKMKANFRVLTETLLQAKWQMDKKEIHIDMERKRETKWIQWSNGKYNRKERHKKRYLFFFIKILSILLF